MKKRRLLLCIVIAVLLCSGCGKSNDGPPENKTPLPEKLEGTYLGEHGTIRFVLTGEDVLEGVEYGKAEVHLTGLNQEGAVLDGEMSYSFTWYSFGSCRYDDATCFSLSQEGTKLNYSFSLSEIGNGTLKIDLYYAEDADGKKLDGLTEDDFTFVLEK